MTEKYPDICQLVLALLYRPLPVDPAPFPSTASPAPQRVIDLLHAQKISSFIMDAEVVAVDKDTGAYRTFQDLSNRAKKDVRVEDIKVVVAVFAFDLMLLNDEVSIGLPYYLGYAANARPCSTHHYLTADTYSTPSSHLMHPLTPLKPAFLTSNP